MTENEKIDKISPKKLFLIDSLGALTTAFLLSVVLANKIDLFGMPKKVLYPLALIALIFAFYSLWNYLRKKGDWKPYMTIIAIANLLYCCLTIGLLFYFQKELTTLGITYFLIEIIIIISLAAIELKTVAKRVGDNR